MKSNTQTARKLAVVTNPAHKIYRGFGESKFNAVPKTDAKHIELARAPREWASHQYDFCDVPYQS